MPISDDEYDSQSGYSQDAPNQNQNLSKAELRKTNKPIMEKKRRARINSCLNELKDLLLEAMKKDPARHSKLEKADILELTVKHLQAVQRQQLAAAVARDPAVALRFRAGFGDCALEVKRYLARLSGLPPGLRARLAAHLTGCMSGIERLGPLPASHDFLSPSVAPFFEPNPLRIDPTTGGNQRPSAFRYVGGGVRITSPPLSPISCDSACDSSTEPDATPQIFVTPPSATFPTPPSRTSHSSDQSESSPETQKPIVSSTTISPETKAMLPNNYPMNKNLSERLTIEIDASPQNKRIELSPKYAIDYSSTSRLAPKRSMHDLIETPAKVPRISSRNHLQGREVRPRALHSSLFVEQPVEADTSTSPPSNENDPSSPSDMWRPW